MKYKWIASGDIVKEDREEWALVAVVYGADGTSEIDDVTHDRAALIAAAPELLKACQSAYRAIVLGNGREIDWNEIADELRDAIAKAEATK